MGQSDLAPETWIFDLCRIWYSDIVVNLDIYLWLQVVNTLEYSDPRDTVLHT